MSEQPTAATTAAEPMSTKVIIHRYPDNMSVIGAPVLVKDLDEAAELLAQSGFMMGWLTNKIKEALLSGHEFQYIKRQGEGWRGRADGVVSTYRLATSEEVLNYVDTASYASMTGKSISRRAQEKGYTIHYHESPQLIEAYDNLPKQAKIILDILNEARRDTFTEASIELLVSENSERLRTKQDPSKIWGFYRKRMIEEGHLQEVE